MQSKARSERRAGGQVPPQLNRFDLALRSVRWWWWRRSKVQVWIIKWGTAGFLLDLALFVATAFRLHSAAHALDVALGTVSPFSFEGAWTTPFTVPLAVLSYLLMPALMGAIVGALLDESVKRWSTEEAEREKSTLELTAAREAERIRRRDQRKGPRTAN